MGNELLAGVGKNVTQTHLDLFGRHLRICDLQAQARCGWQALDARNRFVSIFAERLLVYFIELAIPFPPLLLPASIPR